MKLAFWIVFGSVYLGWHYAIDGIAGAAIALVAWNAAQIMLRAPLTVHGQMRRI